MPKRTPSYRLRKGHGQAIVPTAPWATWPRGETILDRHFAFLPSPDTFRSAAGPHVRSTAATRVQGDDRRGAGAESGAFTGDLALEPLDPFLDLQQLVDDDDVGLPGVDPHRAVVAGDQLFDIAVVRCGNLWIHRGDGTGDPPHLPEDRR